MKEAIIQQTASFINLINEFGTGFPNYCTHHCNGAYEL